MHQVAMNQQVPVGQPVYATPAPPPQVQTHQSAPAPTKHQPDNTRALTRAVESLKLVVIVGIIAISLSAIAAPFIFGAYVQQRVNNQLEDMEREWKNAFK